MAHPDLDQYRGIGEQTFIFRADDQTVLELTTEAFKTRGIDSGFSIVGKPEDTTLESLTAVDVEVLPWVHGYRPGVFEYVARTGIERRDAVKGEEEGPKWGGVLKSIYLAVENIVGQK